MNKFVSLTKRTVMVNFLIFLATMAAIAKSPNNAEIAQRVVNLNTVIDLKITDEVTDQIVKLVEKRREESQTILGRTSLYFPMIENALREKNLPDELKYIAVIESSLLPNIESHQGAAGIWQFMEGTAELYGLKIDKYIDERKDIVKATNKALDYLKTLHEQYGNWTLALAAYNCGSGNINKAIKKANGSMDYWEISKYLPKETQKYIPRFIAASYLMNYYYIHDLVPSEPSENLKYIVSVKVFEKTSFKQISEEFELDMNLIKVLNPMYNKDFIPSSETGEYTLTLPDQAMYSYIEKYNSFDNLLYNPFAFKRSQATDEIIAETRNKVIVEYASGLNKKRQLKRDNLKESNQINSNLSPRFNQTKWHKLGKKESLLDVAEANNVGLDELMALNNLNEDSDLAPGSMIVLAK